jgi:outer membrane lipoprotein-sorting protein
MYIDDLLDRATHALRTMPIPAGPPPEALDATIAADVTPAERLRRWSRICRPMLRLAVAGAALVLLTVAVGRFGALGGVAFADVAGKLRDAKTLFFRTTMTAPGQQPMVMKYSLAAPAQMRMRTGRAVGPTLILDTSRSEGLMLIPESKRAIKLTLADELPMGLSPVNDMIRSIREFAADSVDDLGPKRIGDRPAVGFRVTRQTTTFDVWADPKTKLPVRIETTLTALGQTATVVMDEFVFDEELDAASFSLVPPEGYTVTGGLELAMPSERDLTFLLSEFAKKNGGTFPDTVDIPTLMKFSKDEPKPKDQTEGLKSAMKMTRGLMFVAQRQATQDWRYLGKGVKLGDAGRLVAAWKEPGQKEWKAVYGDLKPRPIAESDVPAGEK